jgi:hypothetical protein
MAAGGGRATPVVDERAMTAMLDEESEPRAKLSPKASPQEEESGPKFNPFEVGARRLSKTPFANTVGEDGPEYGLVATAPAVPTHEIETNERAIEVSVLWGDRNVLNVDYLTPPRDYYVGEPDGEEVDYVLGHDAIGVDRMPLCIAEGAGVTAIVPEGAKGEATIGDQTRSFDLMRGQGDFRPSSTVAGALEFPVPEGGAVRMKHRDFTFIIKDVKAGKKLAGHAKMDIRPSARAFLGPARHRLSLDSILDGARRARRAGARVAERGRLAGWRHRQGARGRARSDGRRKSRKDQEQVRHSGAGG